MNQSKNEHKKMLIKNNDTIFNAMKDEYYGSYCLEL